MISDIYCETCEATVHAYSPRDIGALIATHLKDNSDHTCTIREHFAPTCPLNSHRPLTGRHFAKGGTTGSLALLSPYQVVDNADNRADPPFSLNKSVT